MLSMFKGVWTWIPKPPVLKALMKFQHFIGEGWYWNIFFIMTKFGFTYNQWKTYITHILIISKEPLLNMKRCKTKLVLFSLIRCS